MAIGLAGAPPGLAGWLLADETRRQNQANAMARFSGLVGAQNTMLNMENTSAEMAERQRQRGLMTQFPDALASGDEQRVLGLVGQMQPSAVLPYLLAKADNPVVGTEEVMTPQGPRIYNRTKQGKYVDTGLTPYKNVGAGSADERAWNGLINLQEQINNGYEPTARDRMNAQAWKQQIEQPKSFLDPATGRLQWSQPKVVGPEFTMFGQRPGAAPSAGAPGSNILTPGQDLPPPTGGRRQLDEGTEKNFRTAGTNYQALNTMLTDFKPQFAGWGTDIVGDAVNQYGRRVSPEMQERIGFKASDMSDWWQKYEQWITDIRAAKFGLTLTGNELKAMEKYRVSPKDSARTVESHLAVQMNVIEAAIARELQAVGTSGQNLAQAQAFIGPSSQASVAARKRMENPERWRKEFPYEKTTATPASGAAPTSDTVGSRPTLNPAPAAGTMTTLPPASEHPNKVIEDENGNRLRSVGGQWVPERKP